MMAKILPLFVALFLFVGGAFTIFNKPGKTQVVAIQIALLIWAWIFMIAQFFLLPEIPESADWLTWALLSSLNWLCMGVAAALLIYLAYRGHHLLKPLVSSQQKEANP